MFHLRKLAPLLALLALGMSSCGGDSHEAVTKDSIDLMSDAADILEGVTDKASAEAAATKLEKLTAKAEELQKRAETLGDPDPDEEKRLQEKYEKQMDEITQSMMATMMRLASEPEIMEILGDSMNKLR